MAVPSSLPPQKKRKTVPSTSGVAVDDLEQKLTTAISEGTSLNPLAELINFASTATDPVMTHKAIYALYRVSVLVIAANKLNGGKEESDEARTVRAWISTRLSEFVDFLCGLLKDSEKALRVRLNSSLKY
jgi:U3 small nucleolar RNA-associated protein 19